MTWQELIIASLGLLFVGLFVGLMLIFAAAGRKQPGRYLRDIPAFTRLRTAVGLGVEAGARLHIATGWGDIIGFRGAAGLLGLSMLERIARAASISDRPPVATSGDSTLAILSQDTLRGVSRTTSLEGQYNPSAGRLVGLTPLSYTAGALPVIYDEQVSANVLAGHFGSEVVLLTEAAERKNSLIVAGTDDIPAQAVLFASVEDPLIGEELYAGGAYLNAGPLHQASLRAQDVVRWLLVVVIIIVAIWRLVGSM